MRGFFQIKIQLHYMTMLYPKICCWYKKIPSMLDQLAKIITM